MRPVLDVTAASYATAAIVAYYVLLYALGRPRQAIRAVATSFDWPLLVVLIPARNEARVLERTVQIALACSYPGELRVLIVDDASTDATAQVADQVAELDQRVRVRRRPSDIGGRGKSAVLNHGFSSLCEMLHANDPWLAGSKAERICICVLDADGHLSATALVDAVGMLRDPRVGAVQIGVHIRNGRESLLARLQDIEFVGFSFMVQTARDRLGSVGLGGNGQFTRFAALSDLGAQPWRTHALTEDLDLGMRLQLAGWKLRFCATAWVAQEGLTRVLPLLRQRTRWTQGHYQCWRYLPRIATARRLRTIQRLDTLAYLLLVLFVVLVSSTLSIQVLAYWHVVEPTDGFLAWMGDGIAYRGSVFLLSWLPVFLLLETYQRFTQTKLARWEIPAYCVFFAAYVYLWALATIMAWARLLLRRRSWSKTPRVGAPSSATSAPGAVA